MALISIVVLAAVAGTLLVSNQLNVNADTNSTNTVTSDNSTTSTDTTIANDNSSQVGFGGCFGHGRGGDFMGDRHGFNSGFGYSQIQVSDEYKANVTSIASSDSDVQNLLNNGYNVTSVIPQYTTVVDGNGNVTTSASTAILILTKDGTNNAGKAAVFVDLSAVKVTKIYTETRTLIEK